MSIADKADYVRSKRDSNPGRHHCHWPGCEQRVPPAMWGCRKHWYMLPLPLRTAIWRTFKPGQEEAKNPSRDYLDAAKAAQDWIAARSTQQHGLDFDSAAREGN